MTAVITLVPVAGELPEGAVETRIKSSSGFLVPGVRMRNILANWEGLGEARVHAVHAAASGGNCTAFPAHVMALWGFIVG